MKSTLEEIREQAEAEKYGQIGEPSQKKADWEEIEAELQEVLSNEHTQG